MFDRLTDHLEEMVDLKGMDVVLGALAEVCYEKAGWVEGGGSHGDPAPRLARRWIALGHAIEKIADRAEQL
ncbi:MAG TPA: hypothetical protein VNL71_23960 [Chloroflexota bacterium]|nr:hypothetical protein [Chloroflexota bacterium]